MPGTAGLAIVPVWIPSGVVDPCSVVRFAPRACRLRGTTMRLVLAFLVTSCAGALLAASCSPGPGQETLCTPGTDVYCRCRGGVDSGTKRCQDDGNSFGRCETVLGYCDEIPSQGGSGPTTTTTGTGGEPPPPPPGELLGTCTTDQDCGGGEMVCPMGYCTKTCASFEDCAPPAPASPGDCVQLGGGPICMPYCTEQQDCAAFGQTSVCSYTDAALPACGIVVCANWGQPTLPPNGYPVQEECTGYAPCMDDLECNLGLQHVVRVCQDGGCTDGCHQTGDCPTATPLCTSSSQTELGSCGQGGNPGDECPGEPVSISVADGTVTLMGDTSALSTASYTGTGACDYGASTSTPEWIYKVTPAQSGTLTVLLQPSASFDSVLYARGGTCQSGTQVACDDSPGDGASEIAEMPAVANQPIWIFVDGYDGSVGMFELEMSL